MFGKYFQVEAFWEFVSVGERKTQLTIKFGVPFSEYTVLKGNKKKKKNFLHFFVLIFFLKNSFYFLIFLGTITKNAIKTYTDSHKMFIELSKREIANCLKQYDVGESPVEITEKQESQPVSSTVFPLPTSVENKNTN